MQTFPKITLNQYSLTPGLRNEVDAIFSGVLTIQKLFGYQILDPNWAWRSEYLKLIFTALLLAYVLIGTAEVVSNTNDITVTVEATFTFMITSTFCAKVIFFINSRATFRKAYVTAKTAIFEIVREESNDKADDILKKGSIAVKFFYPLVLIPMVTYMGIVTWNYIRGTRVTLSKTTSILMPMTSPFYEIGLFFHMIYFVQISFVHMVIDMWFVALVFFFCSASDSLVEMLETPRNIGKSDLSRELYSDRLRKFYFKHVQLMEYLSTMNALYKWPTVVPLSTVLMSACLILLLMSEEISWSFASNMLPTLAELFAYNWFGEQIKTKVERLSKAFLNFDWTKLDLKDKKSYCIMMRYINQEFGIKTALGSDLSILTMSAILKASYQFFAVLRSIEE